MNGYQGSLEKHLQQTLFRGNSESGTPLPNPLMPYGSNLRTPHALNQPSSSPSCSAGASSSYGVYGTPTPQRQPQQPTMNNTALNTWEKKDTSQLHPAIRQEYSSMFHQHQDPQCPPPSQYEGPVLQPPVMYDRPQLHAPHHNHAARAQLQQQVPQSMQKQQGVHQPDPQPPISQTIQLASSKQSSSFGQYYQPLSPAMTHSPSHFPVSQPQYQPHPQAVVQPQIHGSVSRSQYEAFPQSYQEKPLYPHQQYFANPVTPLQTHPQDQHLGQSLAQSAQTRDFPDVPADSTSIIEKMMQNLKKATPAASAPATT
jgi:hypothetical protein